MGTQRVSNAGAKPVRLHQHGYQLLQLRFAGSLGQIPQRFRSPLSIHRHSPTNDFPDRQGALVRPLDFWHEVARLEPLKSYFTRFELGQPEKTSTVQAS